ncbi:MAG: hypothetical protein COV60_02945 [Candidatus Magasanikbacteria bacterium CG11_big_fil_rev_8_21_14_0_20_43_7]|uniref:Methyltransferase n=1 Tax=Candidatus Magasanikbacteria bacterium CG11_big_fil_rev_8_21_14_0_20_43_7 TaxID=1974654 RepID=A0A2H0N249_9BACT|nr:MAG: hypothetical protein COV60_02945 [Candidatus Magasanikbacteria bacterium CG11_big_fil_rev_8_21_14_0_20_43_7]
MAIAEVKARLEDDIMAGNTNWHISRETADYICMLLRAYKPMRLLEIGTSTGYSAICLAEALGAWKGQLITVESNETRFHIAKTNIEASGLTNITQIRGHAPEILSDIPGTFDCIFLDATKYEHTSYFHALKDRLKQGGTIVADNILSHKTDMNEYKKTVESDPQFESYVENVGAGLFVSRKIHQ